MYRMIRAAEVLGKLDSRERSIVVDATSGQYGDRVAAMIRRGPARHYPLQIIDARQCASTERKKLLKAYGVRKWCSPIHRKAATLARYFADAANCMAAEKQPDLYFYPDQYGNRENPQAHYETTVPGNHLSQDRMARSRILWRGSARAAMGDGDPAAVARVQSEHPHRGHATRGPVPWTRRPQAHGNWPRTSRKLYDAKV